MYWIPSLKKGALTTMPKPSGGGLLLDALKDWRDEGTNIVVSLLTEAEVEKANLQQAAAFCQQLGMTFITFPIEDYGVPTDQQAALALIGELSASLNRGLSIAVHCWGGIGRSTTVAAAVLIQQGFEPETVFDLIGAVRGTAVPDTQQQKEWVWSTIK